MKDLLELEYFCRKELPKRSKAEPAGEGMGGEAPEARLMEASTFIPEK